VIAHVVLFTPRPSLTLDERRELVRDLTHALQGIPEIRRARIGQRRVLGYAYDTVGPVHFQFVVILEFDSEADLGAYLRHPAHVALGRWFHEGAEAALAQDFELVEGDGLAALTRAYTSA
jgi:Stress responsive A/B Barrel Domain